MTDLYIGIDPGEHNGVALYDAEKGLRFYTMTFWKLITYIETNIIGNYRGGAIIPHFIIENPNLNTFIYQQKVNGKNSKEAMRIARNVGMNQGDAKRIIQKIKEFGVPLEEVKPMSSSQKWTGIWFDAIVGRTTDSNQHERDACKLIARYWANGNKVVNHINTITK